MVTGKAGCACCARLRSASVMPSSKKASASCLPRSEEHTSELQSRENLVCRRLLDNRGSGGKRARGADARAQSPDSSGPPPAPHLIYTLALHDALPILLEVPPSPLVSDCLKA